MWGVGCQFKWYVKTGLCTQTCMGECQSLVCDNSQMSGHVVQNGRKEVEGRT